MHECVPYSNFAELSCPLRGRRNISCRLEVKSSTFALEETDESETWPVALALPILKEDELKCFSRAFLRSVCFEGEKSCPCNLFHQKDITIKTLYVFRFRKRVQSWFRCGNITLRCSFFQKEKNKCFYQDTECIDLFVHQNTNDHISFPNKKRAIAASNTDLACTKQRSER